MPHVLMVSVAQGDLADMADHQKFEPNGFRYAPEAEGVVFRVELNSETEAKAFAQAFDGRVSGEPEAETRATL